MSSQSQYKKNAVFVVLNQKAAGMWNEEQILYSGKLLTALNY